MANTSERGRLEELAQFLRTRRARLHPSEEGFGTAGRRRTPGLRRQEVAQLSGMSVDWYTWMEQARPIQASAQVVESLSRALRLNPVERRHLYRLALKQVPLDEAEDDETEVGDMLRRFLDLQGASPAVAVDQRMNVVAWNSAACCVYGDYALLPEKELNTVWRTFTSPFLRERLKEGWEKQAMRRLAQFRTNYGKFAGDPWWTEMIEELSEASAEFREWWPRHDILDAPEGRKTVYHPRAGELVFGHLSFLPLDSPHLRVTVNIPLRDTASKMSKLLKG